jgi:drug/metabolite transporter (DMT)-like permease
VSGPVLALISSLTGGTGDFVGGTASRRIGVIRFMVYSQLIGIPIAGVWVVVSAQPVPPLRIIATALAAGAGLTVGVAAFFRAMVVGAISIVAPISATGVLVPVVAGIVEGDRPSLVQVAGIVACIGGTMLAARPASRLPSSAREPGVGLACLSALGGGLWFWLMAPASHHDVPWTVLIVSAVPVCLLAPALIVRRASPRPPLTPRSLTAIVSVAALTFVAVATYAFATRRGELALVSVLAGLYPVVPVLLAFGILGERIYGLQRAGVVAVLVGVILLSA